MKQNAKSFATLRAAALLAVSAVLCAANLARGETTAQYVRDGLLACWDGVENAGYRQHAAETDEWIDTVAGRPFALTGVEVQDDRMVLAGTATSYGTLSEGDTTATFGAAKNGTVEIVYATTTTTKDQILLQSSTDSRILAAITKKTSSTPSYLVACNANVSATRFAFDSGTMTNSVSIRYSSAKPASAFANGTALAANGTAYYNGPDATTTLGARTSNKTLPFAGSIYAIRVYSRRLTDDELAANHAVDVSRFVNGYVADDGILEITWSPKRYSTPDPGYGFTRNLAAGASIPVSCPAVWTNEAGTVAATCTGWKLFDIDGNLLSGGAETAFNYVHPSPAAYRRLEWQWRTEYRVITTAEEGGSTSPAVQWVVEGDTATVTATPAAERGFYRWTNDVPSTVAASSATISFPVPAPMSLYATFAGLWHVSPSGDATAPHTAFETGFPTIEEALAVATEGDTILLAPATYVLADAAGIAVTNGVRLVGVSEPAATVVAAKPNGTADSKLLKLEDGRVDGITFSNACMKTRGAAAAGFHASGGSVVANCVLTDFRSPDGNGYAVHLAGTTEMYGSVIRNISTPNATSWNQLIAVYLDGNANVHDCVITNNQVRYNSGGAVTIAGAGAALRRSLVKGNTHIRVEARGTLFAAGVRISAGTLEDCVIADNVANGSSLANTVYAGGVCIAAANTVVRRCVISGNSALGTAAAGGVYAAKGSTTPYHDLLVVGNANATGLAGGIQAADADATFVHCTVYGNTITANASGTPGAYLAKGALRNSIVYGNGTGDTRFTTNNVTAASGTTVANCCVTCEAEAALGTGNIVADPVFIDPEGGDFRLSLISPCRDTGAAVANAGATDLAGVARPQGAAVDMGCYEFIASGSYECAITSDADSIPVGGETVVSALASPDEGVSSYLWTIRDASGERTETTAAPSLRYTSAIAGAAEITCTTHWTEGGEATSRPVSIAVLPSVVHASLTGSHTWPFDTEAKAATNIQQAVDAVYGTADSPGSVYLHEGVWGADRGRDASATHLVTLEKPVRLAGVDAPVLDGGNARRLLLVGHASASASGLAFTRAKSFTEDTMRGSAIEVAAGYVSDCVISNCTATERTADALLYMLGGTAERLVIRDNSGPATGNTYHQALAPAYLRGGTLRASRIHNNLFQDRYYGGALCIAGPAVAEDCDIFANRSRAGEYSDYCTGGVSVRGGGILRRCRVFNNVREPSGTIYRCAGGVNTYGGNATVDSCIITNNAAGVTKDTTLVVGGVYVAANATLINCLIAGNRQTDTTSTTRSGGVHLDGGALINCTVAANTSTMATNGGVYQVSGTVTNCIVWGNGGNVASVFEQHDIRKTGGSAGYSCFGETVAGDGNVTGDPVFRKPALGDFRLRSLSPCIHAGIAIPGLVTDIEGLARSPNRPPTMGCYRFSEPFPTRLLLQ